MRPCPGKKGSLTNDKLVILDAFSKELGSDFSPKEFVKLSFSDKKTFTKEHTYTNSWRIIDSIQSALESSKKKHDDD